MHFPPNQYSNPLLTNHESIKPIREYKTDFSDKYDKSKNKLIYASILSSVVTLFDFKEGSSFLGLKLGGLTDNRLEWMLWAASLFFFLNMLLRYLDERRRFERYKNEVSAFQSEFNNLISTLRQNSKDLVDILDDRSGRIAGSMSNFTSIIRKAQGEVSSLEMNSKAETRALGELEYIEQRTYENIQQLIKQDSDIRQEITGIPDRVSKFVREQKPVAKFVGYGGFRFFVFDLIVPVCLFLVASCLHFIPHVEQFLLSTIT